MQKKRRWPRSQPDSSGRDQGDELADAVGPMRKAVELACAAPATSPGRRGRRFEDLDKVPVFLGSLDVGHGGTFQQPHGGAAAQVATEWLEWRLRGDEQAARTFVGADCGLCGDPKWTVRRKGIP